MTRVITLVLLLWSTTPPALAHDPDHREDDAWYQSIRTPDGGSSCCGVGDAYFCNHLTIKEDKTYCTVTDTRADKPRGRPHVPVGTKVEIPTNKLLRDAEARKGNPTGQGVVWMRAGQYDHRLFTVHCYMMPELT